MTNVRERERVDSLYIETELPSNYVTVPADVLLQSAQNSKAELGTRALLMNKIGQGLKRKSTTYFKTTSKTSAR